MGKFKLGTKVYIDFDKPSELIGYVVFVATALENGKEDYLYMINTSKTNSVETLVYMNDKSRLKPYVPKT